MDQKARLQFLSVLVIPVHLLVIPAHLLVIPAHLQALPWWSAVRCSNSGSTQSLRARGRAD